MKTKFIFFAFLFATLALAACSNTSPTPVTEAPAAVVGCPTETASTETFVNDTHGYCVLIPTGYTVLYPNPEEVIIQRGTSHETVEARVFIEVTEANGRTTESLAAEVSAGLEGFDITRSEIALGDAPAIVLSNMPGQDLNRQVVLVQDERAYHLTFVPFGLNTVTDQQVEEFYALIVSSFSLMPER